MTRRSLLSLILFLCLGATALAPATAGAAPAEGRSPQAVTRVNYPGQRHRDHSAERRPAQAQGHVAQLQEVRQRPDSTCCSRRPAASRGAPRRPRSSSTATTRPAGRAPARAGTARAPRAATRSSTRRPIRAGGRSSAPRSALLPGPRVVRRARFIGGPEVHHRGLRAGPLPPGGGRDRQPRGLGTPRRLDRGRQSRSCPPRTSSFLRQPEQLAVVIARKAYLSVDACFTAGDSGPIAAHLGDAPFGCAVTATYRKNKTESIMLRMTDEFRGDGALPVRLGRGRQLMY